jgi:hypothetical protein
LVYKNREEKKMAVPLQHRNKSMNGSKEDYIVSSITKNKISLCARNGIRVKVFDEYNNFVNVFPSIVSAAKYYNLCNNTLSRYIKLGYPIKDL